MDTPLKNKKYRYGLLAIVAAVILIGGWLFFTNQKTYPLGDKLEYIGRQDYGCVLVCDSNPASTYYYATDMNADDMAHAFRNAVEDDKPQFGSTTIGNSEVTYDWLRFKTTEGQTFYVNFYSDKSKITHYYHFSSNRKYIMTIGSESYPIVKDAL